MKKEMFEHEITILKDTFSRLLRRKAKTNLKKIINKTHPADLAIIFRYFTENEQVQVFKLIEKGTPLFHATTCRNFNQRARFLSPRLENYPKERDDAQKSE